MTNAIDQRVVERLDKHIEKGKTVLATGDQSNVETGPYSEWRAQSLAFLSGLLGKEHPYIIALAETATDTWKSSTQGGIGILTAVREDAQDGMLVDVHTQITGAVFADFMEMAQHLYEEGFLIPAASLAGAVLEDGLRRLAAANGVTVRSKDDAGSLNQRLAEANVYERLEQKRVQTAIDVRNRADHGEFDKVEDADVRHQMLTIETFLSANPEAVAGA